MYIYICIILYTLYHMYYIHNNIKNNSKIRNAHARCVVYISNNHNIKKYILLLSFKYIIIIII